MIRNESVKIEGSQAVTVLISKVIDNFIQFLKDNLSVIVILWKL